jgi:hypothetical protein
MGLNFKVGGVHATSMLARTSRSALTTSTRLVVAGVVNYEPLRDDPVPLLKTDPMCHDAMLAKIISNRDPAVSLIVSGTPKDEAFPASLEPIVQ